MDKQHNLKNIRALLTEGFTAEELRRLCFDESDFRPVYERLAQDTDKATIIDRLLEHVEQKLRIEVLLTRVKELNPAMYDKYHPYRDMTLEAGAVSDPIFYGILKDPDLRTRINKLPPKVKETINNVIDSLQDNPFPPGHKGISLKESLKTYIIETTKPKYKLVYDVDKINRKVCVLLVEPAYFS